MKVIFRPHKMIEMGIQIEYVPSQMTLYVEFEIQGNEGLCCSNCTASNAENVHIVIEKMTDQNGVDLDAEEDKSVIEKIRSTLEQETKHLLAYCSSCYDEEAIENQINALQNFSMS